MADTSSTTHEPVSVVIHAARPDVYRAFTEPDALQAWLAPGEMTAEIDAFDLRVGGGFMMTLRYPDSVAGTPGKTSAREDTYTARFLELEPLSRIVQGITFASNNPAFAGEMQMTITLAERGTDTEVTIAFDNVPPGISAEDNALGTRMSLAKLATYLLATGEATA
jgi:uncharacterized protein YndB with AHSA1/START domain